MPSRALLVALAALLVGCANQGANPFNVFSPSRTPSADAVLLFVSGSWATATGGPRELFAANADGSKIERLTTCTQAAQPCDMLQVAPAPGRERIVAVRSTPGAAAGTQVLYFMDLSRSAETIIAPRRRVESADWSPDGTFLVYSASTPPTSDEDLFYSASDGTSEQNLTGTTTVRERSARIDPFGRTATYELIDDSGVVGADADPAFSPDATSLVFRRLTGTGNGGLGTWDLMVVPANAAAAAVTIASGAVYRGAPDWGPNGILFVETDAATSKSELVRIQPDGSGRTVLHTEDAGYRMAAPRWLK
jgi:Tol biopolymer transport system component